MKRLASLITFTFLALSAHAQLDLGLRAGAGLSRANFSELSNAVTAIESIDDAGHELSYHAGAYLKIGLPFVFIQTEAIFHQLNQTASINDGGDIRDIELDMSRIDIPILVGTKLGPLRAMVGPVYSAHLSDLSSKIGQDIESGTWGYQLGVGIEISRIMLDLRYEGAFSPWASQLIVDNVNGTTINTDLRSSQIILCLGIELF